MTTPLRGFTPGRHWHVFSRGHHKDTIFRDNSDRRYFLSKLDQFCSRNQTSIIAYCLMDNHFHLAMRQDGETPISATIQSLLSSYVRAYNHKHGTVGALFQSRFQAKAVADDWQMARLTRYIHLNPAPFSNYRRYHWSSYKEYATGRFNLTDPSSVLDFFGGSNLSYTIFCDKAVTSEEKRPSHIQR